MSAALLGNGPLRSSQAEPNTEPDLGRNNDNPLAQLLIIP